VLLTTAAGQCIRFPVPDVRVSRAAPRWVCAASALAEGDRVISLSILRHLDASAEERVGYLKARERGAARLTGETGGPAAVAEEAPEPPVERHESSSASSATWNVGGRAARADDFRARLWQAQLRPSEYRTTGSRRQRHRRHGGHAKTGRRGRSFPVEDADSDHAVTNGGQLIRTRVEGIPIASRSTQRRDRVRHDENEKVVSVEGISEEAERQRRVRARAEPQSPFISRRKRNLGVPQGILGTNPADVVPRIRLCEKVPAM